MNASLWQLTAICVLSLVSILTPGCAPSGASLTVFAAAGARPALDEICQQFEAQYNTKVEITYGGGGDMLSKMILSGSGDIYIAPEQRFMDNAKEKQAIDPMTIKSVAYMVPAIAVPKGNPAQIHSLSDLARPGVRVAITRPETTLLGQFAPDIFEKAGLAEAIGKNMVGYAADPNNLLTMLFIGQVDAGITWHFYQNLAGDKIEVIPLAYDQLTGIGEMQAAVSSYSKDDGTARKFIDFIASREAQDIFKKHGYLTNTAEVKRYCR